MSGAAKNLRGVALSDTATTKPNLAVDNSQVDKQWLVNLLIDAGLKGEQSDFHMLAQRFYQQPHTLRLIAAYLKRWYAGRLSGLDTIHGLKDCRDDDALGLILNAFENKLYGASDLTLLYLLSLSDRPVPQHHMKHVFRSTSMERWLTRRDHYVRFLGPLGRLNTEHWHWVIENLRRLQLLEQPIPGQDDLLYVEEPIRQYFQQNLRTRKKTVFEQATKDMQRLFADTVIDFRRRYRNTPEMKTFISPQLKAELERQECAAFWKAQELDEVQIRLSALRQSLATLKTQTADLAAQLNPETNRVAEPAPKEPDSNADVSTAHQPVQPEQQKPNNAKGSKKQRLTLPHTARRSEKHPAKTATVQKLTLPHTAQRHNVKPHARSGLVTLTLPHTARNPQRFTTTGTTTAGQGAARLR